MKIFKKFKIQFLHGERERDMKTLKDYCKSSTTEEIEKNNFILTPGRYVGFVEEEDDGLPFEEKIKNLFTALEKNQKIMEDIKKTISYE
jgi:type I restriction enzyme M protein